MTQIKQIKQILIKQILSKILLKNVKFKIWILQKNLLLRNILLLYVCQVFLLDIRSIFMSKSVLYFDLTKFLSFENLSKIWIILFLIDLFHDVIFINFSQCWTLIISFDLLILIGNYIPIQINCTNKLNLKFNLMCWS